MCSVYDLKNTENGLSVLNWWRNACLNWCHARYEDGKFGDQMYLDDWTIRFTGVHELKHLGGGVAPWNMQQYSFQEENSVLTGNEISSENKFDLVFFHFHGFSSKNIGFLHLFHLTNYQLSQTTKKLIFLPYISEFQNQFQLLQTENVCMKGLGTTKTSLKDFIKAIVKWILRIDTNIFWE